MAVGSLDHEYHFLYMPLEERCGIPGGFSMILGFPIDKIKRTKPL